MFACRQFLPETILHFKCVITKSDCTIRYSSVGELLCVHILNKAFRVLKKKKKKGFSVHPPLHDGTHVSTWGRRDHRSPLDLHPLIFSPSIQ